MQSQAFLNSINQSTNHAAGDVPCQFKERNESQAQYTISKIMGDNCNNAAVKVRKHAKSQGNIHRVPKKPSPQNFGWQ